MTNSQFPEPPLSSQAVTERKAQYAAWRDRLMNKNQAEEIIDLSKTDELSPWSADYLFDQSCHVAEG